MPEGLEIKDGPYGRGVYATRRFDKAEAVEHCPTLELPGDDVVGELGDYVFGSNSGDDEVTLLLGYGMLYNHSSEPNCEYVQEEPRVITFVTTRPVEAGEELFIDYGEEWWSTRNREPERPTSRSARASWTRSASRSTSSATRSRRSASPTS